MILSIKLRAVFLTTFALCALALNCYSQNSNASKCAITKDNSDGWKRYYLEGPDRDAICVYLPGEPQRFPGGKLRGGRNVTLTATVYLVAQNEETYAVAFVYDLPGDTSPLSDDQKSEVLFGTWQAIAGTVRQALQRRLGDVDVKYSDQTKVEVGGRDGRVQLFQVGPYLGQARILFVDKKAYMLVGLWPQSRAEQRSAGFFDSFEMRVQH